MRVILGLSAYYHDSAAVLLVNGEIIAAAQEERFTRKKHTADFPENAIKYCFEESGYSIDEIDVVVFYDKPLLKFERLLETYYSFAPRGLFSFLKAIPVWLNEKLFLKKKIYDGLKNIDDYDKKKLNLLFSKHHLSHAASAYFSSPFNEAAILTIDGVGEWTTASICHGIDNKITMLKEMKFPHSVGLLYSAFTYYLGFRVNSGEYKLMGLAPYANPESKQTKDFINLIKNHIVNIKDDGSVWLNQEYFNYCTGLRMTNDKKWEKLFGLSRVEPDGDLDQEYWNLAYAIQKVTEEIVIKMSTEAKSITGSNNLCLAGGVALNCVANGKLIKKNIFKDIFIQPAAGDAGGALGAAQMAHYMYYNSKRESSNGRDLMKGAFLGPEYSNKEAIIIFKKYKANYKKYNDFETLCKDSAKLIRDGNVIGWFQGRMEFGPRALGNRSILGDARNLDMQKKLNLKIKYREGFRPFAPSVMIEYVNDYFDSFISSPYMLLVADVKDSVRKEIPKNYYELDLWDRLYLERSELQAITHVDFSARVQTVHKETNLKYWQLINSFKELTNYGVIVNTSFNVRGEPIVCTPDDAYRCFMRTEMDYLVINNYLLCKIDQPEAENKNIWMEKFKLD
jgi:carbamoyltransferase